MSAGKPDPSQTSGPFYTQYDAVNHPHYSGVQHQTDHGMQHFDMNTLGHALPPTAPQSASRQYAPFEDQSVSYANHFQTVQPPHMQHMNATNPTNQAAAQRAFMQHPQQQHIQHQQQHVPLHQLQPHTRSQYPYNPYPAPFPGQVAVDVHGRGYNVLPSPTQQSLFLPAMDSRYMLPHAGPSTQIMPSTFSAPPQATPRRPSETGPTPSYPRGPPRKPKQSGHALWVGNLPPGTSILDLKDHFSRNATNDIESLFLMSKSNCAFVNYKTEPACQAAMNRFHDSRFQGVRLVCRLRKGSTASSQQSVQRVNSASQGLSKDTLAGGVQETNRSLSRAPEALVTDGTDAATEKPVSSSTPGARIPERFFIVKSLTMQDLEASVRDGIWATQSHNENELNRAFDVGQFYFHSFYA